MIQYDRRLLQMERTIKKMNPGKSKIMGSTGGGFTAPYRLFIRAAETSAEGRSIYLHDPAGKVSTAYAALTQEVLA